MILFQFKDQTAKRVRSTKPVVIAVLDTGIYRNHPDLKDIVVESENFVTSFPGRVLDDAVMCSVCMCAVDVF